MTETKTEHKYEYLLHVWGGFWNEHNIKIHGEPYAEYLWFDTAEEREAVKNYLLKLAEEHGKHLTNIGHFNDSVIVHSESEGYLTRYQHVIQSLVKVGDEIITVENNLGYGFYSDDELKDPDSSVEYMKDWKWRGNPEVDEDDATPLFTTLILRK